MRYSIFFFASFLFLAPSANANSARFIDVEIVVYDDRFYKFIDRDSQVEILAGELEWAEGPVWVESLNALLFSLALGSHEKRAADQRRPFALRGRRPG